MATNIKTGSYTGDGAAQNISVGFEPDYVRIINATDGTTVSEWFNGMAAGSAITVVAAAGPVLDAANQITAYAGSTTAATGFTVGTDLSVSAKVYYYLAIESGPGAQ